MIKPHIINNDINKSDYNDNITKLYVIYSLHHHVNNKKKGIIYDEENKRNALDDTINYCLNNNIYPVNVSSIPSKLLYNVKNINDGNIEEDWTICRNYYTREINKCIYI